MQGQTHDPAEWVQPRANILLIQTAFPGDVLFCLPLAVALHAAFPDSKLIGLTSREAFEVWNGQPCFGKVLAWDKRGRETGLRGMLKWSGLLRSERIDTAIVAHASTASAVLARLSGATRRIGFNVGAGRFLHTGRVDFPRETFEGRYRGLLVRMNLPAPAPPIFQVSAEADRKIRSLFEDRGWMKNAYRVALSFGSKIPSKKWPARHWATLARRLRAEKNALILLIGSGAESAEAEDIRARIGDRCVNLTGFSIPETAAVLQACHHVVGVDSFGLHLARFLGVPSIGVYGPTDPRAFDWKENQKPVFQSDVPCRPCTVFHAPRRCPLGHHDCMERLSPETVLAALPDS